MANIGIMSMQRIVNYGSFLQAYGLKKMLEELGHNVQFVDFHVGKTLIESNANHNRLKIDKILEVLRYDVSLKQKLQFVYYKKNFAKKYNHILGLSKKPNYTPKLDILIIGSDEVFNCIQQNPNVGYSLELFGKNNCAKKVITYAASFGNTTIEKLKLFKKEMEIGDLLRSMEAISVRDSNSGLIVKQLTDKDIYYNLDPVLAYDYINKCNFIPTIEKKEQYMILYAYSGRISNNEAEWIEQYAKLKKMKIYAIGGVQKCADRFIDCSPFELLAYFKNAEEVITDTFHGTIFSIITKKRFVTLVRKSKGNSYGNEEKLTDLLNRLNLSERIIYDIKKISQIQDIPIKYEDVDAKIIEERRSTKEYLKKNTL